MYRPSRTASALAGLAAAALACTRPAVGPEVEKPSPPGPPATHRLALGAAAVNGERRVQVTLDVRLGDAPVSLADLAALRPAFALAELATDPESGIPAWRSHLLTGGQTAPANPIGGPGTRPENVLEGQKQPGSESTGTFEALPAGGFRYTFANALPEGYATASTYRIAAWLGAAAGTADTNDTLDFVPSGAAPAPRDLVADEDCRACHVQVLAHGRRVGVRVCTTCHTFQAVDPDTVDPAAPLAATAATNPNPLDFGRLVHRIHRGKNLPTLHASSSTDPAPALGTGPLPYPFTPGVNAPVSGRRYTVIGYTSRAFTWGEVRTVATGSGATRVVAGGVTYPRDYRDCTVCHARSARADDAYTVLSRRTCAGCHPDVWFGADAVPDTAHLAHPGGPQDSDTLCAECHLATATPAAPRKLYVDNRAVHTAVRLSPRFSPMTASIVSVTGLVPGGRPTVTFTLSDRSGTISPLGDAANPPPADASPTPSPIPRRPNRVAFTLSGPTSPDHRTGNLPLTETVSGPLVADAAGRFTYTFQTVAVPAGATGAWAVMLEARRQLYRPTPFYDPATDTFAWPYTGEGLTEYANNATVAVDTATGSTTTSALPRRVVVDEARCNACHGQLVLHGGNRSSVQGCALCHTPDQTDWGRRPKGPGGNVDLAATLDGIEERSVELRTMIHRIHTGARTGVTQLDAEPYVIYGYGGTPYFFDEALFPANLADCRTCHDGETFRLESIPWGAPGRVANETATVLHAAAAAHPASEPRVPPMTAACTSCHDTGTARSHAAGKVVDGEETCVSCHGADAALSVYDLHGLARP